MPYRRILLPIDGSAAAEAALADTIAIAEAFAASVVVLEVIETPLDLAYRIGARDEVTDRTLTAFEAERTRAREDVERVAQLLRPNVLLVDELVYENGQPGTGILRIAADEGCDLIVMSTSGRGGLERGKLGTVTDYVVRHATIPVLVNHASHGLNAGATKGAETT